MAQRPLTLPKGEFQLLVAGGATAGAASMVLGTLELGIGLTERLELRSPLVLTHHWGSRSRQVAVGGGLLGIGPANRRAEDPDPDPRQPVSTGPAIVVAPGGAVTTRFLFSERWAVVTDADGRVVYDFVKPEPRFSGGVSVLFDIDELVSLGLSGRGGVDLPRDQDVAGRASGQFQVWWHLHETTDLTTSFDALYRRYTRLDNVPQWSVGGTLGVDVHF